MKSRFRASASALLVLAVFAALLLDPAEAAEGARHGLKVCAGVIVPSLLPFLILSGLLTGLGFPQLLARLAAPLTARLFALPGAAAVPLLLGLTGGYPVGAASAAELVRRGELTPEEASRCLPLCNNTGPAFIIGAVGSGVFSSPAAGLLLYLSHILAAVTVGLLGSIGSARTQGSRAAQPDAPERSLARCLPESVKNAATATLDICGFVVFFSVLMALLDAFALLPAWAGALSVRLPLEIRACRALLAGVLELGTGIAAMNGLTLTPANLALAAFLLGFGGLSVHCQTLSAVEGTEIRLRLHFPGRLLHGALSAAFSYALALLLTRI